MPVESTKESASTAILLLKERLSHFETREGRLRGLSFQPRPNDVGISTSPKAGTTWLQQICHQIRCAALATASAIDPSNETEKSSSSIDGCMDFEEISAVVPWIELAHDLGQDLEAEQPPDYSGRHNLPRLYKTHCWYQHCPRFPKTIVVFRDPCDVFLSFYRFFEGWFFEPGTVDIETFADDFWLARGVPDDSKMQNASYFVHLNSWYVEEQQQQQQRSDSTILILFYEDLVDDLHGQVQRVARFLSNDHCNFDTEDIVQHAVSHSTYAFMKQHESKFDEKLTKRARNKVCGLPSDAGMTHTKINSGKVDMGKAQLPDKIRSKIQQKWTEVVLPVTGCATYAELRHQFALANDTVE